MVLRNLAELPMLSHQRLFLNRIICTVAVGCFLLSFWNDLLLAQQQDDDAAGKTNSTANVVQVENALLKTIESTRLAAEIAGKINALHAVEGDVVSIGQPLGNIRDTAVRVQLERAKIAMAIARKKQRSEIDLQLAHKKNDVAQNELELAESANNRIPNTYGPKEIDRLRLVADSTQLEIERANHEREVAELEVLLAENEYRQAEELLARHQILSPAVGVVVAINKRVGEWVEPGTELLEIVKIDRLRIEGFVSTEAASNQLVNHPAYVTVLAASTEQKVLGRVVFVSPDANPVNGLVRVYLEIDNSQRNFRPGMRVKATIDTISSTEDETQASLLNPGAPKSQPTPLVPTPLVPTPLVPTPLAPTQPDSQP